MARFGSGALGGASGKLGNVVFSINKGRTIGRAYQPVVRRVDSESQVISRTKMKAITQSISSISESVRTKLASSKLSSPVLWSSLIQHNVKHVSSLGVIDIQNFTLGSKNSFSSKTLQLYLDASMGSFYFLASDIAVLHPEDVTVFNLVSVYYIVPLTSELSCLCFAQPIVGDRFYLPLNGFSASTNCPFVADNIIINVMSAPSYSSSLTTKKIFKLVDIGVNYRCNMPASTSDYTFARSFMGVPDWMWNFMWEVLEDNYAGGVNWDGDARFSNIPNGATVHVSYTLYKADKTKQSGTMNVLATAGKCLFPPRSEFPYEYFTAVAQIWDLNDNIYSQPCFIRNGTMRGGEFASLHEFIWNTNPSALPYLRSDSQTAYMFVDSLPLCSPFASSMSKDSLWLDDNKQDIQCFLYYSDGRLFQELNNDLTGKFMCSSLSPSSSYIVVFTALDLMIGSFSFVSGPAGSVTSLTLDNIMCSNSVTSLPMYMISDFKSQIGTSRVENFHIQGIYERILRSCIMRGSLSLGQLNSPNFFPVFKAGVLPI